MSVAEIAFESPPFAGDRHDGEHGDGGCEHQTGGVLYGFAFRRAQQGDADGVQRIAKRRYQLQPDISGEGRFARGTSTNIPLTFLTRLLGEIKVT